MTGEKGDWKGCGVVGVQVCVVVTFEVVGSDGGFSVEASDEWCVRMRLREDARMRDGGAGAKKRERREKPNSRSDLFSPGDDDAGEARAIRLTLGVRITVKDAVVGRCREVDDELLGVLWTLLGLLLLEEWGLEGDGGMGKGRGGGNSHSATTQISGSTLGGVGCLLGGARGSEGGG